MSELEDIRPTSRNLIYDLVKEAGVNVSEWKKGKGGAKKAATNPKFCYEWSFVEPKKLVVLNLWYELMKSQAGDIVQELNARESIQRMEAEKRGATVINRARRFDEALFVAHTARLPVRVIVCDGVRRDPDTKDPRPSSVRYRYLDPVPWVVTSYDGNSGECIVTRGSDAGKLIDQHLLAEPLNAGRKISTSLQRNYERDRRIRNRALARSSGKCECCGELGFETDSGNKYLETHHIQSLSDGGDDSELNVVAICANCHRKAHHGVDRAAIRSWLIAQVYAKYDRCPPNVKRTTTSKKRG